MQDIIYVAIPIAFFALCATYVRGLDRLVRSGEEGERSVDITGAMDPTDTELTGVGS